MLNYKEQIDRMTVAEKIAFLSGGVVATDGETPRAELPHLGVAELWDANTTQEGKLFPCPASLANSMNPALFASVADILAARGEAKGNNLFILPDCKAPIGTFDKGLSEDPLVNSHLIRGCAEALAKRGTGFALQMPVLKHSDVEALAGEMDMSVLYDRIARPYHDVLDATTCRAVICPEDETDADCREAEEMLRGKVRSSVTVLRPRMEGDHAVQALLEGNVVLQTDAEAIEAAYQNYLRIHHSIEEGGSTIEELHAAQKDGSAINEEALSDVVVRRVNLAAECIAGRKGDRPNATVIEQVAYNAARGSIVLLKNKDDRLPLSRGTKIAMIGDVISEGEESEFIGFRRDFSNSLKRSLVIDFERGYRLDSDRSDLADAAVALAKRADVTVLFLGWGSRREAILPEMKTLELPANQMALFDALVQTGKPVIAVVVGTRLPAMEFDSRAAATLLIPPQGMRVPHALANILEGKCNPTGRLAFAGKDTPDIDYMETQMYMRRGEKKIGPFIGYRASVSEGTVIRYPFGYGLSYNTVEYKKMSVMGDLVRVKIHNRGRLPMTEIVQVYMGKPTTALLRPKMELKGFMPVELKGGETRSVMVPIEWLEVLNTETGQLMCEGGRYHFYASHYAGVKELKARTPIAGGQFPQGTHKISDYLDSVSNICSNQYTMEGFCEPMKTRSALKCLGAFFILLTLFADVFYITGAVLDFYELIPSLFFAIGISLGIFVIGMIFLTCYVVAHGHDVKRQEKIEKKSTEALFRNVQAAEVNSLEDLFVEEFDIPEEMHKKAETTYTEEDEGRHVHVQIDTDLPTVAKNMENFFSERGLVMSHGMVRTVLSSMMTSRFIILRHVDETLSEKFISVLAEFFGTVAGRESFEGRVGEGTGLLYKTGFGTNPIPSNVFVTLQEAQGQPEKAHFVSITKMALTNAGAYMTPFIRYFSNPNGKCKIKENGETFVIPANLWMVLNVKAGDSLESLEPFVANYASVVDLKVEIGETALNKQTYSAASCAVMETLIYRSRKSITVDEDLWKAVDRLEEFVNERAAYHIGNKLFLQMESYIAVYCGCGGEMQNAMDSAIAAKLLPAIIGRLRDAEGQGDMELSHAMEDMFGDGNIEQCRYMLKNIVLGESTEEDIADVDEVIEEPIEEIVEEVVEETAEEVVESVINEETFGNVTVAEEISDETSFGIGFAVQEAVSVEAPAMEETIVEEPVSEETPSFDVSASDAFIIKEEQPADEMPVEEIAVEDETDAPIEEERFTAEPIAEETDVMSASTDEIDVDAILASLEGTDLPAVEEPVLEESDVEEPVMQDAPVEPINEPDEEVVHEEEPKTVETSYTPGSFGSFFSFSGMQATSYTDDKKEVDDDAE